MDMPIAPGLMMPTLRMRLPHWMEDSFECTSFSKRS